MGAGWPCRPSKPPRAQSSSTRDYRTVVLAAAGWPTPQRSSEVIEAQAQPAMPGLVHGFVTQSTRDQHPLFCGSVSCPWLIGDRARKIVAAIEARLSLQWV